MSNYFYEAVDASGLRSTGRLDVADQSTAIRRIREMGLFPTDVHPVQPVRLRPVARRDVTLPAWLTERRVKPLEITTFTRQLATLVNVGMPLLRGLRLLHEQEENRTLKRVIAEVATVIESGGTLSEALAAHPKQFSRLYVNMVRAGEAGGVLEVVLRRQAEFMEKTQRLKARVKAALFYPIAVLVVAMGIMTLLMVYVIPRFKEVFQGMTGGKPLPAFTQFVMNISDCIKNHFLVTGLVVVGLAVAFRLLIATRWGRHWWDRCKMIVPAVGKVVRKVELARFARTTGTLLTSGVPILQTLTIARETTGNVIVGGMITKIHENVKTGGSISEPLKSAGIFPAMIGGMVDVGEQTGALPEMLLRIADNADEDVDNAVSAMTSLIEPVMIIFLAVVVGSIVIAMFLPILGLVNNEVNNGGGNGGGGGN